MNEKIIDKKDYHWLFYCVCVMLFFNYGISLTYLNYELSFGLYIFISIVIMMHFIVFSYLHYEIGYKLGYKK